MTISAKVIADSISEAGRRIVSVQLRYPRFIHAELMTHRVFSRNASSSRAVPVEKLIEDIIRDTAMPIHWGKNQPGMQANEECDELVLWENPASEHLPFIKVDKIESWIWARDRAIEVAKAFDRAGYHKQIVNRLLEPFSHINVLVTSTEWDNFFSLRRHKDAQPEIHELANKIWEAMGNSSPQILFFGDWHLPYVDEESQIEIAEYAYQEEIDNSLNLMIKCSVARCARVSYLTHDQKEPNIENDLKLYDRLMGSDPLHASPAEHQATPDKEITVWHPETHKPNDKPTMIGWEKPYLHGNFVGWIQYRKTLE